MLGLEHKEKLRFGRFAVKAKDTPNQGLGGSDKPNVRDNFSLLINEELEMDTINNYYTFLMYFYSRIQ